MTIDELLGALLGIGIAATAAGFSQLYYLFSRHRDATQAALTAQLEAFQSLLEKLREEIASEREEQFSKVWKSFDKLQECVSIDRRENVQHKLVLAEKMVTKSDLEAAEKRLIHELDSRLRRSSWRGF